MGIDPLFILENNLKLERPEDIISYIADKTHIPAYLIENNGRQSYYERWEVEYYEDHIPHYYFQLVQARDYNLDYLDITTDYVICRIDRFEELTWYGILNVFKQGQKEHDNNLVPSFKRMLTSYKSFGELFHSKALLICPDSLFESIEPYLICPFKRSAFSSLPLNSLSFDSTIVTDTNPDDHYLYLETWL
ncbi:MAG TPA: hypothetical protein PLB48_12425 [Treponema sp.]|jgi:hypothetical protein|nr:hypothetical protein [Treponema sp.]